MTIRDKLKQLDISKDFIVTNIDKGYAIEHNEANISVFIDGAGKETYYITGVYNSNIDTVPIDIERLDKLKALVKILKDKNYNR